MTSKNNENTAVSEALGRQVDLGTAVSEAFGRQVGFGTAVLGALGRQVHLGTAVSVTLERFWGQFKGRLWVKQA